MSLNAATIELLLSKGLSGDDILEVARALEKKRDNTNAERQARHRAKKAGQSNGVTVTAVTGSPNEYISNPLPLPSVVSSETTSPSADLIEVEVEQDEKLKPEHVVEAWNTTAERLGLPVVRKLTPERRRKLATRIRQNTVEDFTEAICAIEKSPFLRGENGRGWKADFDWMIEPKNFTKLTEGTYGH